MKTSGGKVVISSKRNLHGVRVFIPEKLKANGTVYVQPYTFRQIGVFSQTAHYSVNGACTISPVFSINTVVMTFPFSAWSLRQAIEYAMSSKNSDGKRAIGYSLSKKGYYKSLKQ